MSKDTRHGGLQFAPVNDNINCAFFAEKLRALEPFWQFFANGLLNHTRARKRDHRAGLSHMNIAKHRIRRGHATRRWVAEHHNIRQAASLTSWMASVERGICIKDSVPSCIRAPPEAEQTTKAALRATAICAAAIKASPAAMPSDPPIKAKS
eukprot:CAMPEP_0184455540 /NCGR_PEP_ID=MMETSP0740-20130409/23746_1 /TAXON_ID=385413 /ORGANISM="Thalassiosira miniscula, Strain CCMP1093" /LENGTH=151 /DNA_ID=CAMNT_0026827409 /DNA_START=304 /DNA_END=760 /DNA_ORIENTATION=-